MEPIAPIIVRRLGRYLPETGRYSARPEVPSRLIEDLRLFALGWVGGLVFFGTLFS
jgi:hypothetical protein